jgi:hypothetical protein
MLGDFGSRELSKRKCRQPSVSLDLLVPLSG